MKTVALVSGGKDSCFAMMKCIEYGHEIVALANLLPADDSVDDLDSYMYQTVGHQMVVSYSKCMGVPLYRRRIQGCTRLHNLCYSLTPGDEVEDMFILLSEVKKQIPSIAALSTGAIASDYQRLRVENVCSRLGLVSLAYLWKQDQTWLLKEMIRSGIVAILAKVASLGLDPSSYLGRDLENVMPYLLKLQESYGINVCGEGGEYETLTLDCPLFKNARIVLDEFQVVFHSSDPIAPVGILQPVAFHLEEKKKLVSTSDNSTSYDSLDEFESVYEVLGYCSLECEPRCHSVKENCLVSAITKELHVSKAISDDVFTISCWLQDSCKTSAGLEEDLKAVLMNIELKLSQYGFSWEHALYIHLYVADMKSFVSANEVYIKFITQEKCRFGVPSRCTIELPMLHAGLGSAYVEVLVANDNIKRVLHVQSISCWAPSCIGPYSQATLHKEILYMAGQLGLDPPTMVLCGGGAVAELEQALKNCEAVAQCFNCSITTSTISFVIFCSVSVSTSERKSLEDKVATFLNCLKSSYLDSVNVSEVLDPIFLYVLVPDLPKSALIEVKPILYAAEAVVESASYHMNQESPSIMGQSYWAFQNDDWHDLCLSKCVVRTKICAAVLSVTEEIADRICSELTLADRSKVNFRSHVEELCLERIARFCVYYLDKVLLQNSFSWNDAVIVRIYVATRLQILHETIFLLFRRVFDEFAKMSKRLEMDKVPLFNIVPVIGVGISATSMDDIITCELFARKF